MKVDANLNEAFSEADQTSLQHIKFQVTDTHGYFSKLEHDLTVLTNKFELGGRRGVDIHGFNFFSRY